MGKPITIDSDVLNYLIQEHLALLNEVKIAAKAAIISCEYCTYSAANLAACATAHGECTVCSVHGECICSGCGGRSENFEWRGVVEANMPDDEEVAEFVKKLRKCTVAE